MSIGASILDASSVRRYVTEERGRLLAQLEGDTPSGTDVSRQLLDSTSRRLRAFELILRLLSEQKTERPTAAQALESEVFGVTPAEPKDPMEELEDVSRRQSHHARHPSTDSLALCSFSAAAER